MDSLHAAAFDPGGINAHGPDASVSSPSKRTSRGTSLRTSSLIEPTTTGAQNLDATKAFHDWIIAKDIQSIAEVDNEHTSSDALPLFWDDEENFYDFEPASGELFDSCDLFDSCELFDSLFGWSEYPILLATNNSEPYIHSWVKTHESEDDLRCIAHCRAFGSLSASWIPSTFTVTFTVGMRCTLPRFTHEETTLTNSFFNTSWLYLLGHLTHPPASRRLLDHHVRELPCANYPPAASC
jgi:hypothetical protein